MPNIYVMITNLNPQECSKVLERNYLGNLAYIFNDEPYVIPITYFFDAKENYIFDAKENYIICYSGMGHKIRAMRKKTSVSLAVAEIFAANLWKSVLVHGTYKEVNGTDAKAYLHHFSIGIKEIIHKRERKDVDYISEFSSKIYNDDAPIVFLIRMEAMTGKSRSHVKND